MKPRLTFEEFEKAVNKDIKKVFLEYEKLHRKCLGLETTNRNLREKLSKMQERMLK